MNKIIYLIIIVLFIGCQNENSSIKTSGEKTLDKRSKIEKKSINIDNQTKECNCDTNTVFDHLQADLRLIYYNSNLNKAGEDSLKLYTSTDSIINSVRSLMLNTLEIPKELYVFKNIEQISFIGQHRNNTDTILKGLNNFSKLESISLWGVNLSFNNIQTESPKLKKLRVEKSKISSFKEIRNLSELNSISMFHSGLDALPNDWQGLSCLNKIHIHSHSFGRLDLTKINLHELTCIEEVQFTTIINEIIGIPEGTGEVNLKKIKIEHPKLTNEEKEMIKASR